jgi:hypothetical protein
MIPFIQEFENNEEILQEEQEFENEQQEENFPK